MGEILTMAGYRLRRARHRLSELRLAGHTCPERQPIGRIEVGEIEFLIERAEFRQGHLVLTGTANVLQAGPVQGHVRIYGTDDVLAFRGQDFRDLGIKTAWTVWQFTDAVELQGTQPPAGPFVHDVPPPPPEDSLKTAERLSRWLAEVMKR